MPSASKSDSHPIEQPKVLKRSPRSSESMLPLRLRSPTQLADTKLDWLDCAGCSFCSDASWGASTVASSGASTGASSGFRFNSNTGSKLGGDCHKASNVSNRVAGECFVQGVLHNVLRGGSELVLQVGTLRKISSGA